MYRRKVDGAVLDFGTTGALRDSNLLMYDRQTESWWQEFGGEGVIGHYAGHKLEQLYLSVVSWGDFKAAYPDGRVLSKPADSNRAYGSNPYYGYDRPGKEPFLFRGEKDPRLPAVERVVAIERGSDAWAVSFTTLAEERAVSASVGGEDVVVFWTAGTASALDGGSVAAGRDVGTAGIFSPIADGKTLTFAADADADGSITDEQTGSMWDIFGQAVSGPLAGTQLTPVPGRIGQLWFSWAVYRPDTVVYGGME